MWRSSVSKMKFRIEKGMHIVIEGSVGVYTPRGEYQFYAVKVEPYGQGALALAFEQLKERLKAKGYFDAQRKKMIPKQIRKLVLVTAKDSAALHDMLKIIEKRWPLLEVYIIDTLVQGESAAAQIARSLKYADSLEADVIVLGRGGGSTEDLWAFNEEQVADAIYHLRTPLVSAVGHEVDVLISDFVADLRAPTPSAAIEMILPDAQEILYTLDELLNRYRQLIRQKLTQSSQTLKYLEEMLTRSSPARRLEESTTAFDRLEAEFTRVMEHKLEQYEIQLPLLKKRFEQQVDFMLQQKSHYAASLLRQMQMNDPRLQCKKGWAQILKNAKAITLTELKEEEIFTVEDASVKVEARCLKKTFYDMETL